jgi:hypothetical protein
MKWPEGAKKVGLFDPSRPKVNERPGLLRPDGSQMHAIVPEPLHRPPYSPPKWAGQ